MEDDFSGQWQQINGFAASPHEDGTPLTSILFDNHADLLWAADSSGWLRSFESTSLARYTSVHSHATSVVSTLSLQYGLVSVGMDGVRMHNRGGMPLFSIREGLQDLRAAIIADFTGLESKVLVGGEGPWLHLIDLTSLRFEQSIDSAGCATSLCSAGRMLAQGSARGALILRDPHSLRSLQQIVVHAGPVTSIACVGDQIISCGWQGEYADSIIHVVDTRMLRTLAMVPVEGSPSIVHPYLNVSNTAVVGTHDGMFTFVDASIGQICAPYLGQGYAGFSSVSMSPSGNFIALGDNAGHLQLWSDVDEGSFLAQPRPVSPLPTAHAPKDGLGDHISLELLPADVDALLSNFPPHETFIVGRPAPPLDPQIVPTLKQAGFTLVGRNPRTRRRNQTAPPPAYEQRLLRRGITAARDTIPRSYARVEGWREHSYNVTSDNPTQFSCLEPAPGPANVVLRALYALPTSRGVLQSHYCLREPCLACEFGFLSHMLDCPGAVVHTGNFVRAFRQLPATAALGLRDNPLPTPAVCEAFARFVLTHVDQDTQAQQIQDLFATKIRGRDTCKNCGRIDQRDSTSFTLDLQSREKPFIQALASSLVKESELRTWCPQCRSYATVITRREAAVLPEALVIGCGVREEADMKQWRAVDSSGQLWLPDAVVIELNGTAVNVRKTDMATAGEHVYVLAAIVSFVKEETDVGHAVVHVNVPAASAEQMGETPGWFLFNDLRVTRTSSRDALSFANVWRQPALLMFVRRSKWQARPAERQTFGDAVFNLDIGRTDIIPVRKGELGKGAMIAIDAEFVSLERAESEVLTDGTQIVTQPSRLALARVSALRGSGMLQGTVILNDYIQPTEPVVDFLTRYSGIVPGDLDPATSRHFVTTLKPEYLKLRRFVDAGVTFVGHGLSQDFRIMSTSERLSLTCFRYLCATNPDCRYIRIVPPRRSQKTWFALLGCCIA
eukprot:TRINITY_DN7885_c0_g1_i2.p1 TRINITY_DN7885_c0_g1~~TRINITY_DN7885_c0_g1_i2.p1  ORF type:complete len:955 (+),score=130.09 TRINITY_DN7885_c0_g1_i2:45-2909(+)